MCNVHVCSWILYVWVWVLVFLFHQDLLFLSDNTFFSHNSQLPMSLIYLSKPTAKDISPVGISWATSLPQNTQEATTCEKREIVLITMPQHNLIKKKYIKVWKLFCVLFSDVLFAFHDQYFLWEIIKSWNATENCGIAFQTKHVPQAVYKKMGVVINRLQSTGLITFSAKT